MVELSDRLGHGGGWFGHSIYRCWLILIGREAGGIWNAVVWLNDLLRQRPN
jgi:hypothetical protein